MVTVLAGANLDPKDVVAPIGVICGAAIAAFVAWFNARQTATERLQTLIAIFKDWPTGVTGKEHIAGLIRGQLGEMWHRYPHLVAVHATEADRADIEAAAKRHLRMDYAVFTVSLLVLAACFRVLFPLDEAEEVVSASLIVGFTSVVAVSRALRLIRHYL